MASYSKKPQRPSPKIDRPPVPAAKPEAPAPWIEARAPEIVETPAAQTFEAPAAEVTALVAPEAVESSAAPDFEAAAAELELPRLRSWLRLRRRRLKSPTGRCSRRLRWRPSRPRRGDRRSLRSGG